MKRNISPVVALVVVVVALGAVYFLYTSVFQGKTVGYVGPPGSPGGAPNNRAGTAASPRKPAAGGPTREMYGLPPLPKEKEAAKPASDKGK